jgi:hypothetical protein
MALVAGSMLCVWLILLFTVPRWMPALLTVAVAVILAAFVWVLYSERQQVAAYQDVLDTLPMSARFDLTRCPTDAPLLIEITNHSTAGMALVAFTLQGFWPGSEKAVYEAILRSGDRVIPAGKSHRVCREIRGIESGIQPQLLNWRATPISPSFSQS